MTNMRMELNEAGREIMRSLDGSGLHLLSKLKMHRRARLKALWWNCLPRRAAKNRGCRFLIARKSKRESRLLRSATRREKVIPDRPSDCRRHFEHYTHRHAPSRNLWPNPTTQFRRFAPVDGSVVTRHC